MSEINKRIKELRNRLNLTQDDFGERIGLSKSGISNIENGTRSVSERHIKLISNIFGVSEDWLKTGIDPITEAERTIKKDFAFTDYLESIGITVRHEIVKWHWENEDDRENAVQVADEVIYTLFKGETSSDFTQSEFDELQKATELHVNFQIWMKNRPDK